MGIFLFLYISIIIIIITWIISFLLLSTYKPIKRIFIILGFIIISLILIWPICFISLIPSYEVILNENMGLGQLIVIGIVSILNNIVIPPILSKLLNLYKQEKIHILKLVLWLIVSLSLYTVILSIIFYNLL